MGQRLIDKSASELYTFVRNGGLQTICLPVLSVGLIKLLNMSNNAGRLLNTSFIGRSSRHNLSVSIRQPSITWSAQHLIRSRLLLIGLPFFASRRCASMAHETCP